MFIPKVFSCIKNYDREQFIKDFIAGIIVAIIALPLSIALAIASGVTPEKGLYTAIIGGFFISLLGGSRVQIGGPTGAFVVIVSGIIAKYGVEGLTTATIMAGIILIIMGIFKFGNMIKYIPYTITTGFTSGIAVVIFSTQIKDFLGLTMQEVPSEFLPKWIEYTKHMNTIDYPSLFIGILSLLIIIVWPKINKKIPGTLIAVIFSTLLVYFLNIDIDTIGSRFGELNAGLPTISMPDLSFNTIKELIMPAFTIAVLGAIESLLSAVVADGMIGGNHRSNIELIGQGVANFLSGLFGGIPATGAIARTAANVKNGGRTPVAGMVHAIALLFIMLLFMPYVKLIPMSCLAAILIMVSYNMGEWEAFGRVRIAPKSDAFVFLLTFILTVFLDLVVAIGVGMILSSFLFMQRMIEVSEVNYVLDARESSECVSYTNDYNVLKNIVIYEISGPFFFGAADKFVRVIKEVGVPCKVLIVKMGDVPAMDATAFQALKSLYKMCQKNKRRLILVDLKEQPKKVIEKYGFVDKLGLENICDSMENALERAKVFI